MNEKASNTIRLVGGGYLIYLAFSLVKDVVESKPSNMPVFIIAAIIFCLVGGYVVFISLKRILCADKAKEDEEVIIEEDAKKSLEDTTLVEEENVEEKE